MYEEPAEAKAQPVPSVMNAVEAHEFETNKLYGMIDELLDRLDPILTPSSTLTGVVAAHESPMSGPTSPLAQRLRAMTDTAEQMRSKVHDAYRRLELP